MRFSRSTMLVGGLAIALAVPAIAIAKAGPDTSSSPSYIIGGSTVSSAPWAAQVYRGTSFTCSGTIIAPTWVLTAKHCVGSSMSVRVGNVNRGSGTQASVTQYYNAPNGSDLSLLKLASVGGSTFSRLTGSLPPTGSTNQIFGWGMTSQSGSPSTVLKTADVRVTNTNCRDAYGGQAICSSRITGNAWKGDSGGPQFYNGLQVGVASTADGTSTQQYTAVAPNLSWINSMIGGSQPTTQPPTSPTTRPPSSPTSQPPTSQPPGGTTWQAYTYYAAGTTVTYNGVTYRCLQSHTAYPGWEPPNVPALWARV